jgi:hypothetical protein
MLEKKFLIGIGIANIALSSLVLGIFIGAKLAHHHRHGCGYGDYDCGYDDEDDYYGLEDFEENPNK